MTDEETKENVSVYVSTELRDKQRIETIRDNMMWRLEAETFYKRVTPHITIVPPFQLPKENIGKFREVVNQVDNGEVDVKVNGAAVWRNLRNPYVVMLDVDVDLGHTHDYLVDRASMLGGFDFKDPVDPHITLLKSKGWWEVVPHTLMMKLQKEIHTNRMVQDTQITEVKLMVN